MGVYDQQDYDVRCEWGREGVEQLSRDSDAIVIVDVLSFSTCVEVATQRGALVYPFAGGHEQAAVYADSVGAILALARRSKGATTLSPTSLLGIAPNTRLVLPSPNGSTLSVAAENRVTIAGCLRNAKAVAAAAQKRGKRVSVIAAGERWRDSGGLRPAFEDWVGAGAIISHLEGSKSPEAMIAEAAFHAASARLTQLLFDCASGRELVDRGFSTDVALAAESDVSVTVPILTDGCYAAS